MRKRTSLFVVPAAILAAALSVSAGATGDPLRVAAVNRTATNWPLYAGLDRGIFARHGVDLSLEVAGSSTRLMRDLLAGGVDIGHMAAGNVVEAVDRGDDLFIVMAINRPVFALVSAPRFARVADLRGATLGVDNDRTGYIHLVRQLLGRAGLEDGDYRINDVGGVDARYRALVAGEVDAALLSVPRDLEAMAAGYRVLATLDVSLADYAGSVAVARRGWAAGRRDLVVRYIRAYREALAWLYDPQSAGEAAALLARHLEIDVPLARDIYRDVIATKRWLVDEGALEPPAMQAVLRQMERKATVADVERYVDWSYVREAMGGW